MKKIKILKELNEHTPFTLVAVLVAFIIVIVFHYILKKEIGEGVFYIFHFGHILVSAVATTGLYYKYKKNVFSALLIGVSGALVLGSVSDVIFPHIGAMLLDNDIHFHLPLIEETAQTVFFAIAGSIIGIVTRVTKISHLLHVFLSVFASLFYLLAFTSVFSAFYLLASFFIVFVAVIIPCCLSDIVFPLIFIKK
jgi:hypothetical protein